MIIGIDLGTTNSAAAYLSEGGPRLIANALGQNLTQSVVALEPGGEVLVGRTARELQVLQPDRCVSVFKRYMGSDWSTEIASRKFNAELLSALVLRSLKQDAEAHLGYPIHDAVITVPAYFKEPQRKATLNAGRIAELNVRRILNEPTAAALAYGMHETGDKVIAVVDLGGGTFDVSIVDMFEGTLEVRASAGESFLGGEDFTRTLVARVLEMNGQVFERAELDAPRLISRLSQECEVAKCRLSSADSVAVRIPNREGELTDQGAVVMVTRTQFEDWTKHILARIELPIRRALGDAGLNRLDVQEVILVGGATRMPLFRQRIAELFDREPHCRLSPDEVVAMGAAVQSGLISGQQSVGDLVVTDVSPFTLGIDISKRLGSELRDGYFLPIVHRNTTIPVSRVETVQTTHANQTEVRVQVYQGESRRVEDNLLLGEFTVPGIPRGPAGQSVEIRFTYDLNGILEVEATVVETRRKVTHLITKLARQMDDAQIARAVQEMQALKSHPREEAVNRFLLRRAERLYQELSPEHRQFLSDMLDGFEAALELGEPDAIERHREQLQEYLDRCEQGPLDGPGPENDF